MQIDSGATVLVTGATGFVGRTLVHQLSERGATIKILAREGSEARTMAINYDAELVVGDILSKSAAQAGCANATHIFHLAGRGQSNSASTSASAAETRRVNVSGTKTLARCAAAQPTPPKFVHFSTVAIHGDVKEGPGDEHSPYHATSVYEQTKLEAELWLREFAAETSLPLTILRPCAIVGPGDQRLLKLFKLAGQRWIPIVGTGMQRYQLIHVEDCARVMLAVAEATKTNAIYICGNAQTMTLREILAALGVRDAQILSLPARPITAGLRVLESIYKACGLQSPIPTSRLAFFTYNRWFATSALQRDLAPQLEHIFQHTNKSALAATQRWYEENGML